MILALCLLYLGALPSTQRRVCWTDCVLCIKYFELPGKGSLSLAVLSHIHNLGAGRLLGYGKYPESRLLQQIESSDRDVYCKFAPF